MMSDADALRFFTLPFYIGVTGFELCFLYLTFLTRCKTRGGAAGLCAGAGMGERSLRSMYG
jgi:hypothetical protein